MLPEPAPACAVAAATSAPMSLCVPDLSGREAEYLNECIVSTYVSSVGPFVDRFEAMVARAGGAEAAVATSSGTTGLHAALATVGVGRDDLVILPSYTFVASANAIAHCGADPWLLDVRSDTWSLDPAHLARELDGSTERRDGAVIHRATGRRVAAVMPVHTMGLPADMDPIVAAARAHDLPVVADAAAAIGATYKGRPLADLGADLSVFSFNGNKTVTAGGGGAVFGRDRRLLARVKHLTTTARRGPGYDHDVVGFNYRMTNLEAAVGCAQMERLEALVTAKRRIAARYRTALAGLPGVEFFPAPTWAESACWLSGVVACNADAAEALRSALVAAGIDARPFWKPMHLQPPYRNVPRTALDVCDLIWARIVPLPSSPGLAEADQARAIAAVCAAWR